MNGTLGPAPAPPAPAAQVSATARSVNTVIVEDFDFKPGVFGVAVPPGTSITWTNNGPTVHTTTSDSGVWDSGDLQVGQSFSFTFTDPGVYWYFCRPHPFMRGTITIDPNAPAPASGAVTLDAYQ
jgi:plastocyanin